MRIERELTLRSLSPLALHAERNRTQFTPGLNYISGMALRGAAAAHHLQARGEDDVFRALFVLGQASFPDLLPSTEDAAGQLLPATARLCKRHRWTHAGSSLTDALLRLALAQLTGKLAPLKDPTWEYCTEEECRKVNKRDRVYGYVAPTYDRVPVEKRLLTGNSINRATGTAEAGFLFSQEALTEGLFFRGVVRTLGDDADKLQANLESLLQAGTRLRVGAARSRGLGLAEVIGWSDPRSGLDLALRFTLFKRALDALWRHYEVELEHAFCFSLTLESHTVLRDRAGRPVTRLKGRSDLSELLGLEGATLGRHVILPAMVRGWNAQLGLPKEDVPALGRGSALFFQAEPGCEEALRDRLAEIEAEGLGSRRGEGFGRIRVCDPFHYDFLLREMGEARR